MDAETLVDTSRKGRGWVHMTRPWPAWRICGAGLSSRVQWKAPRKPLNRKDRPMKTERKSQRVGPVLMKDEHGNEYDVYAEVTMQRTLFLEGTWSEWNEESKRFFTSGSHVNPPGEDGWWEVVATGVRIRP